MFEFIDLILKPQVIVMMLTAVAAFATVLTVALPLLDRDRMTQRMRVMAVERDKMRAARLAELKVAGDGNNRLRPQIKGMMQEIVETLNMRALFETEELRDKLKMAGFRGQAPVVSFMFFRVLMPPLVFVIALLYLFVLSNINFPPIIKILISLGAGFCGFYLPNLYVSNAISRRQVSVKHAFPDSLDMLLICVQSGMSIESAFCKVGKEIAAQSLELAEEFSLTTAELAHLSDRRQAYENLSKRTGLPGIKAVMTALIQAERYGTPVGQALRVMAKENRDMRMSEAEKKAAALPPKLTVPMIVFFLPVLFIVIMGPAIMQVMHWAPAVSVQN